MQRSLAGKRILITGASGGIGECLARQAASQQAHVLLLARSTEKLSDICAAIRAAGGEAAAVGGDVTIPDDRQRAIEAARTQMGGLDVLINNAGVASFGHFSTSSEEVMRKVMEVNFFAPAEMIRAAIPLLTQGSQPAIVNIASMCGRRGMPAWPEYSASKFALCGLTEALRGEMTRFDIDVLLIVPGLTGSNLSHNLLRNEGRMKIGFAGGMTPQSVAVRILDALKRNRTETILGWEAWQILFVNKFFPRLLDRLSKRKVRILYEESSNLHETAASGQSGITSERC
jgi:short-subunit dehydrogenase